MKQHINKLLSLPLISGAAIIFISSQATNVLQFLFHLVMNKYLATVSAYGDLATLTSIITWLALVAGSLLPTVVNFSSKYFVSGSNRGLYLIYKKLTIFTGVIAVLVIFLGLSAAPVIAEFLQIESSGFIVLTSFIIGINVLNTVVTGLLQAKLAFGYISFANFISALVKFVGSFALVILGYGLYGILGALILSTITSYILNCIPIRNIFSYREKQKDDLDIPTKDLMKYGVPAAAAILFLNAFTSTDLLMVKHFFTPEDAGMYAGLMLVGKVIFFFSFPIGLVMFPLITNRFMQKKEFTSIFLQALGLVAASSLAIVGFYTLFPDFTIRLFLQKKEYLAVSSYLPLCGLFITLFAILSLMTNFFLAVKRVQVWIILFLGALFQLVGVQLFHQNFTQVFTVSILSIISVIICMIFYYQVTFSKSHE